MHILRAFKLLSVENYQQSKMATLKAGRNAAHKRQFACKRLTRMNGKISVCAAVLSDCCGPIASQTCSKQMFEATYQKARCEKSVAHGTFLTAAAFLLLFVVSLS